MPFGSRAIFVIASASRIFSSVVAPAAFIASYTLFARSEIPSIGMRPSPDGAEPAFLYKEQRSVLSCPLWSESGVDVEWVRRGSVAVGGDSEGLNTRPRLVRRGPRALPPKRPTVPALAAGTAPP